ncbi:MAG TPA: GH92 family glycosyl hydrolase [Verrucomicrobiae bacterium]
MKNFVFCVLTLTALSCAADPPPLFSLANPMQGTDSQYSFSHGNQYPAIALPFPMNVWAPYTEPQNDSFYYQYQHNTIYGIRQTHQPSPWIGDYANFSFMPVSGQLAVTEKERVSTFRHEDEVAQPSYYKVHMDRWDTTAEVTPTLRGARFRFTYDKPGDSYVVLDVFKSDHLCSIKIIPSENKIVGYASNSRGGTPDNFKNYFVIQFDQPFTDSGFWNDQSGAQQNPLKSEATTTGRHIGAYFKFHTRNKWSFSKFAVIQRNVITCKVASSFISPAQAELNLKNEIGIADFDTIRHRAETTWNDYLGRAQIEGGMHDQLRTFYTSLYHAILWPHRFFETNADNQAVYFSPYDGKVHQGYLYTDTGYWDTFRSAHPLYNILYPEISAQIMQSIINVYNQSGSLPEWTSPGYRVCMIGNHAFSVLTDAWMKGIRGFDAHTAVAAMVHDANANGVGRDGADFYNSIGYVPYSNVSGEQSVPEAGSKTIEYSYDDFCAALMAKSIGDTADFQTFSKHATNYKNVFDAKTGFMRGRRINGQWDEPFHPNEWGGPFTEGSSWQWTFNAMQDEPGFAQLMGGWQAYADKLDALFAAPPIATPGTYGKPIHEMTEMTALNMGQYAANNEPVNHLIYLYDYAGQPWKTQVRARQAMTWLYDATPDGISGDDDTGQMSAWYVFSALGFYPVCPGDPIYFIGSPLFDKAILHLQNGKTFTITGNHNMPQEYYIQSGSLNRAPFDRVYLTHDEIMNGGDLDLQMGSAPNYDWGVAPDSRPPSPLSLLTQ